MWRSAAAVWLATATLIACATTSPALRPADSPDGGGAGDLDASQGTDVRDPADPAADRDGDGVANRDDRCPDEPEDRDDFEDTDGCRELDNDHDRILDAVDKCPNEAETYNAVDDDDGCPDKGLVVHAGTGILGEIQFAHGKAAITPDMNAILDQLAARAIAEKRGCYLTGSATDDERRPLRLIGARAAAVKKALLARGVPSGQITVNAPSRVVTECGPADAECRRVNRRVEISM